MKNGIVIPMSCTVELAWGARALDFSKLAQVYEAINEQMSASSDVVSPSTAESNRMEPTRIAVDGQAQAAKLVIRIPPEYPANADGLRGTVRFRVLIGIDGRVRQAEVMDGDPGLTAAAAEAVKQWVYQPTLTERGVHGSDH